MGLDLYLACYLMSRRESKLSHNVTLMIKILSVYICPRAFIICSLIQFPNNINAVNPFAKVHLKNELF